MDKLFFSCNWGAEPNKAWSGTSMGLYKELSKIYEIKKLDINVRVPVLIGLRFLEKIHIGRFDMVYMKYYSKIFQKYFKNTECNKVFQFDECPNNENAQSYIFMDLSANFLLDVFENQPDLVPYCGLDNMSLNYLRKRSAQQNAFLEKTSAIFTMGNWLKDYLIEHLNIPETRIYAVGGGINVEVDSIDYSQKKGNKILFIGRDFKRKGGDIVVNAFRILKEKVSNAELYIAGPKDNPMKADSTVEGIFFLGEQNRKEIMNLYNICDVFCMPSRFEAYGLVFVEALVFGLPCIGRNAFSMREFIQDSENGYLIDSDDLEILASKMEMALKNQAMIEYVQSKRDEYIVQYSWESVVSRISAVIDAS